ncbi:tRNA dimethylallyltransferase [Balneicella halophila]|uniref:tRNA dimethylallyltransferase n=1 Tax=Balneicella halophila TaxID=1537566 RepID=A0A7L4UT61_BALHA|nr:tRNA (adenosine(37)-N6)-dimethylallyltransferase MiaA [Balneicella halophila]PVX52497.1 tRNA dimethylallyltransferase [Balneicella halophila]
MSYNLLCVLGATATGKTNLAVALARYFSGEIISADSRQIYRAMNIGTGKDLEEYGEIPFHLIDIHPAGYKYNVFEYQQDFQIAFKEVTAKDKLPILCGGSGLYLEAVLENYEMQAVPENKALRKELEEKSLEELVELLKKHKTLHNTTDTSTKKRTIRALEIATYESEHPQQKIEKITLNPLIVGIKFDVKQRRERITKRLHARLEEGMVDEVKNLIDSGVNPNDLIYYGLEYKYITLYLTHQLSYDEMVSQLNTAIHRFAKRQMTWFRRMERKGIAIHWLDGNLSTEEKVAEVTQLWK